MPDGEPLIWYTEPDDTPRTMRYLGGTLALGIVAMIGVAAFRPGPVFEGLALFTIWTAMLVFLVSGDEIFDRRAVVEVRLTPTELTLVCVDRSITTCRLTDLRRIEVTRALRGGTPTSSRMRLHFGDGVVLHTRHGQADLPDQWTEVLNAAEVDIDVRERNQDD